MKWTLGVGLIGLAACGDASKELRYIGRCPGEQQGAISGTDRSTDIALSGPGFLALADAEGLVFTRDGRLQIRDDGQLVHASGRSVLGWQTPAQPSPSSLQPLRVPLDLEPRATTRIDIEVNLDASTDQRTFEFALEDPGGTSNWSASFVVYDANGQAENVTIFFARQGANAYGWHALTGRSSETATFVGEGRLDFNTDGMLAAQTGSLRMASGLTVEVDFAGEPDALGTTAFADPFTVSRVDQDGFLRGELDRINFDPDGIISAIFTNSQLRIAGQLAIAVVESPCALVPTGASYGLWRAPEAAGTVRYGVREPVFPSAFAEVLGGALEAPFGEHAD